MADGDPIDETADRPVAPVRVETVGVVPGRFGYPDETRVVTATGSLGLGLYGSLVDLTFVDSKVVIQPDGEPKVQNYITARVRFDLDMAKRLRDQLSAFIEGVTPPPAGQAH